MSRRLTISDQLFRTAEKAVPPPLGCSWQHDPSYSEDRLRLWKGSDGRLGSCVGGAYAGGVWWVNDPKDQKNTLASGERPSLCQAMHSMVEASREAWGLHSPLEPTEVDA